MEVSGYFSLLAEDDLVSELEKLTKERISKEEEGSLTDLRKKMMSMLGMMQIDVFSLVSKLVFPCVSVSFLQSRPKMSRNYLYISLKVAEYSSPSAPEISPVILLCSLETSPEKRYSSN